MDPKVALLKLAVFAAQTLLTHAPELFLKFKTLFERKDIVLQDFITLSNEIEGTSYENLVSNTRIPPDQRT